jgi:SAM-dependent methyltransferase
VNFDRIAPHYRWLETVAFGRALQDARVSWLSVLEAPRRALLVGEGNGRFLCELLRAHPALEVDCLDLSARMLELARKRLRRSRPEDAARVHFREEDLRAWLPNEFSYDLIVTHFVLDCFDEKEVEEMVANLAHSATPDATWLLADFSVPRERIRRWHAATWLWLMHRFFRVTAGISATRLTDPAPFLEKHGFRRARSQLWRFGLVKSDLWQAPPRSL